MNAKTNLFSTKTTLNCAGRLVDLSTPSIMGILNITPDSFYDGGKYNNMEAIIKQNEKMLKEGALFIDVGGQSTRPKATLLTEEEELQRVIPVIEALKTEFKEDILISIDTFYSRVAKESITAGACLINDVSGGSMDAKMFETTAALNAPYILMHMQGTPATMQQDPEYKDEVEEVLTYFIKKIAELKRVGVRDIIIDPGFGFGKNVQHNFVLLKHLDSFKILGLPVMAGLSRKSMICKTLHIQPVDALNGTTALNMLALQHGVNLLRVHDVKEAVECIRLYKEYDTAV